MKSTYKVIFLEQIASSDQQQQWHKKFEIELVVDFRKNGKKKNLSGHFWILSDK